MTAKLKAQIRRAWILGWSMCIAPTLYAADTQIRQTEQTHLELYMQSLADGDRQTSEALGDLLFNQDSLNARSTQEALAAYRNKKITREILLKQKGWSAEHEQVFGEVMELYQEMYERGQKIQHEHSSEFIEQIKLDNVRLEPNSKGYAKYVIINDVPMIVVVHRETGIAFNFVPQKEYDTNEAFRRKLERFASRQHISSERPERHDWGRHVVFVAMKRGKFQGHEKLNRANLTPLPKPRVWTLNWWRDYWSAIHKPNEPNRDTVMLGTFCGLIQGATTACLMGAANAMGVGDFSGESIMGAATATATYALIRGSFQSTLRGWRDANRIEKRQLIKEMAQSLVFNYALTVISNDGWEHLSLTDPEGIFLNGNLMLSAFIGNLNKTAIDQKTSLEDQMRVYPKDLKISLGSNTYRPKFTWATWKSSLRYMFLHFPLKLPSVMLDSWEGKLMGYTLMLGTIPLAQRHAAQTAEALKAQHAGNPQMARIANRYISRWEKTRTLLNRFVGTMKVPQCENSLRKQTH